jgi:REP element-mobilizing transposase RayT
VSATGDWDYFLDEVDRSIWVRRLVETMVDVDWSCAAFCQMSTHVHLLLRVRDSSLSVGMRELNREYSRHFNLRHQRVGTFVRGRFGSRRIKDSSDLLGAYAYVVGNPVRAGACRGPDEWAWSSYRTTFRLSDDFPFVDATPVIAEAGDRDQLRRFVESRLDSVRNGHVPEPGSGRVF